ncbi:hypothetical protein LTR91_014333 [Friedmanniomyces endolithicus]|uniref:Uncharacterized protein n=1 Tax=Friedmanniomyces endolithicus TaxID=329885 RepID=A0AAN6KC17_9PEZI|nr:hypothetical protein LTR59_017628 [Friedmanniomyces endolithicus]KAK0791591.1 hypothetical protein LTR38_010185 [Friedmanniomyces endolithicus]KAK0844440.1 hypothetical protein LTS02_015709 [Friedmanniomyces endolithicus]KAK0855816.1 hypothetical protein LTR03_001568 [Friedmanniomyces endolithicus]KAK0860682.1 hypothetical protein LTR87_017232 [Friedmanniomyces endolithicus]
MPPRTPPHVVAQGVYLLDYYTPIIRSNLELYGAAYPPSPTAVQGRPRALTDEQSAWMLAYLDNKPTAYLDELALAIYD